MIESASKIRIVLSKEYFDNGTGIRTGNGLISDQLAQKYDFKVYSFQERPFRLSKMLENTSDSRNMIAEDFKYYLLCLINVCDESKNLPAYNFMGRFQDGS